MNPKTHKIIWSTIIWSILLIGVVFSASRRNDPEWKEALKDRDLVLSVGKAGDIENLEKLADELEKKWFQKNKEYYGTIICNIAEAFSRNDSILNKKNKESFELGNKYAKMALDKLYNLPEEDKISINAELHIVLLSDKEIPFSKHLRGLTESKDWPQKRREIAKYYFRVWERLEKAIDPNWKPLDRSNPSSFIRPPGPPPGYKGPFVSGMSADSIEDPNLRAEYEAALKEYWEKMRQHSKQYGLRRIKESDLPIVQRHILGLYSGPAFDSKNLETEALKLDISKYVKDDKIRITMLEGMKNRIIENAKPPGKVYIIPDERKIRGWPTDK